jgi:hypothetical protein
MKALLFVIFLMQASIVLSQRVGIGTSNPDPSAKLDVASINSGFLAPRMTSAQRNQITNPALGLMIINTTTNSVEFFDGSSWQNISSVTRSASRVKMLIGTTGSENVGDIQATADGGFILIGDSYISGAPTGSFAGLLTYGANDIYIAKFDGYGSLEWHRFYGGTDAEQARSIQQTTDGGYILSAFCSSTNSGTLTGINSNGGTADFLIMKLDASGNITWQKLLGGSDRDEAFVVRQTADGGYIAAGHSFSSNTGTLSGIFNNGDADYLVIKMDASGNVLWKKLLGGSLADNLTDLQQVNDGGYVLVGASSSSNTGTMPGLNTNGGRDFWIVKLDATGNTSWQKLLGGSGNEEAYGIQATADGGCLVSGRSSSSNTGTLTGVSSNGALDLWILKLNPSGNIQWQKLYGGANDEGLARIQVTSDGGSIVSGYSSSSNTGNLTGLINAGSFDSYILKLDASGNIQWQKLYGGTQADISYGIRVLNDDSYIITGISQSSNSGTFSGLFNYGGSDIFLLRIDKNGKLY